LDAFRTGVKTSLYGTGSSSRTTGEREDAG
jgi:hypothetical protein